MADESGLKAAGIAVIALDTGRVLMQQRALNPVHCPCGMGVTWDEMNGYQHSDGSVSHDGEYYGQSVSDLLDQGHHTPCSCCQGAGEDKRGGECMSCDGSGYDYEAPLCSTPCRSDEADMAKEATADGWGLDKTAALEFDPHEGTWEFPGGKLDEGESPRDAAIREFREEVGQDLPPGIFVGAWVSPGGIAVTASSGLVALAVQPGDQTYGFQDMSGHTAPSDRSYAVPLHNVEDMMQGFYDGHHNDYSHGNVGDSESISKILAARDQPDKKIRIYRAVPHGISKIYGRQELSQMFPQHDPSNLAEWVGISKDYALEHAQSQNCPKCGGRLQVISGVAKAKDLLNEGYPTEWGYVGDATLEHSGTNKIYKTKCPTPRRVPKTNEQLEAEYDVVKHQGLEAVQQWEKDNEHDRMLRLRPRRRQAAAGFQMPKPPVYRQLHDVDPRALDDEGADQAYKAMAHDPYHPAVQDAYDALERETVDQLNSLHSAGLHVQFHDGGNDYPNSKAMVEDVGRGHLWTRHSEGDGLPADHPMSRVVGKTIVHTPTGPVQKALTLNDVFRAVHDVNGHAAGVGHEVVGFGPKGEFNAWLRHRTTYSDGALPALWNETRGQAAQLGPLTKAGVPLAEIPFVEQKAGVPPQHLARKATDGWCVTPGRLNMVREAATDADWKDVDWLQRRETQQELEAQHPTRRYNINPKNPYGYASWTDSDLPITKQDEYNGLDQPMVGFRSATPPEAGYTDVPDNNKKLYQYKENDPACATCYDKDGSEVRQSDHHMLWHKFSPLTLGSGERRFAAVKPVYKGFIYLIQKESDIDLGNREIANPDDPDGDMSEQSAWWDIEHAKENPALREEVKQTPWDELELWADKSVRTNKSTKEAFASLALPASDHVSHVGKTLHSGETDLIVESASQSPSVPTFARLKNMISVGRPEYGLRTDEEIPASHHDMVLSSEIPDFHEEKNYVPGTPKIYGLRSGMRHTFLAPVVHTETGEHGWLRGGDYKKPQDWTFYGEHQLNNAIRGVRPDADPPRDPGSPSLADLRYKRQRATGRGTPIGPGDRELDDEGHQLAHRRPDPFAELARARGGWADDRSEFRLGSSKKSWWSYEDKE